MPDERYSDKILTDARTAVNPAETFGMEMGQRPLDEAHTAMAAGTGELQEDLAPFGSRAAVPTSGAEEA